LEKQLAQKQRYWWVNQTRMHSIERDENKNVVAGEINVKKQSKTHWGRSNVLKMKKNHLIVCYRSEVGMDQLARVKEDGKSDSIPWDNDETRKAYVAEVEYLPIKPITKKDFWDDLEGIANCDEKTGPIDHSRQQVRYAYAMRLTRKGFDKIIELAESRNPGKVKKWADKYQMK
jgi:hypothetical protein